MTAMITPTAIVSLVLIPQSNPPCIRHRFQERPLPNFSYCVSFILLASILPDFRGEAHVWSHDSFVKRLHSINNRRKPSSTGKPTCSANATVFGDHKECAVASR